MSVEDFSIHPQNQVLAGLRDTRGNPCGEEVLRRVISSDIFILLGEPAVGKSTITDQITYEMRLKHIPYETVVYDDVLDDHVRQTGSDQEGLDLNIKLAKHVLEARMRIPQGGVVIFDTCAVGKRIPKDRSVTAVNYLAKLAREGNDFFSKLSILAMVGSLEQQRKHANMRHDIDHTPTHLVLEKLRHQYNIVLVDMPHGVSETQLGEGVQAVLRRTARDIHITAISHEIAHEDAIALQELGPEIIQSITAPESMSQIDRTHVQLRALGMLRRSKRLGLSEEEWMTVINPEQSETIFWYAGKFLPRSTLIE